MHTSQRSKSGILGATLKCLVETVNEHGRNILCSLVFVSAFLCLPALGVGRGQGASAGAGAAAKALPRGDAGPTFDVVSIKPQKIDMRGMIVRIGYEGHSSRFYATGEPVAALMQVAYGVRYDQIVNEPGWARDELFEVRAQGDEETDKALAGMNGADAERMRQHMLQAMLADRFGLTVHRSVREAKIFALMVAPHGPKFSAASPSDGNTDTTGAAVFPRIGGGGDSRGIHRTVSNCSMTFLAKMLSSDLRTTVVDRTGLKGLYNFKFSFSSRPSKAPDSFPDEYTALGEQLGLKLVAEKGSEEVITIDHIEKPTPD